MCLIMISEPRAGNSGILWSGSEPGTLSDKSDGSRQC